jgi:flagellar hook protein FlgE
LRIDGSKANLKPIKILGGKNMLRSLYSGVSGMKVNQTKMDVIGNNIANVGTTAFKSGRVRFQDMLSQTSKQAMGAMTNTGGTNANQVGLGVQVAGIDTIVNQGSMQPTGNNLDVAIDGAGYFMVGKGPEVFATLAAPSIAVNNTSAATAAGAAHTVTTNNVMDISYTRDGSFTLDSNGDLLTSDGLRVLGYSLTDGTNHSLDMTAAPAPVVNYIDPNSAGFKADDTQLKTLRIPDTVTTAAGGTKKVSTYSIGKDGLITAVLDDGSVTALGQIAMASFKNPAGLTKSGKNLYAQSSNSGTATLRTGTGAAAANDNSKAYGDQSQGMLEMSNVDLAEQFTEMIVTSRAFQASGKMITTGDEMLQDIINLKR